MVSTPNIPSPRSTGGAGYSFEYKVAARFLALLLVGGIPAIFTDRRVVSVSFQTKHLGWQTDDLLLTCLDSQGETRRMAIQSKLSFTLSDKDVECVKTFAGFWSDFNASDRFNPDRDVLVLVVQRGTNALMDGLGALVDCSRVASGSADFNHRLTSSGLSALVAKASSTIRDILKSAHSVNPSNDELWRFLKSIYVLPLDLDTSSGQDEAWTKMALAHAVDASVSNPVAVAGATWSELIKLAAQSAPKAAVVTYDDLPQHLRETHRQIEGLQTALQPLEEHAKLVLDDIRSTIGAGVSVDRDQLTSCALEALSDHQVVILDGSPGSGKSALAKGLIEQAADASVCLSFWAEDLAVSHLDDTVSSLTGKQFQVLIGAQQRVLIHVERVERLLDCENPQAFFDLLNVAAGAEHVNVILTCRDHAVATVRDSLVSPRIPSCTVVQVPLFTDGEVDQIASQVPSVRPLLANPKLKELLRNPYCLSLAANMNWTAASTDLPDNETRFRQKWWDEIARRNSYVSDDFPHRRERALVELAVERAKQLRTFIPMQDEYRAALEKLRQDGVVRSNDFDHYAPSHDVIEDWALSVWIESLLAGQEWRGGPVAAAIDESPGLRRSFRKWLTSALEDNAVKTLNFAVSTYNHPGLPRWFRDDVLVAVLRSSLADEFLAGQRQEFLAGDGSLLTSLMRLIHLACTRPLVLGDDEPLLGDDEPRLHSNLSMPDGQAWPPVLELVAHDLDTLLPDHLGSVVGFIEDWVRWKGNSGTLPDGSHSFARIAYDLLEYCEDNRSPEMRKRVLAATAVLPQADEDRFRELLARAIENPFQTGYPGDLADILLRDLNGYHACRAFPEEMVGLTKSRYMLTRDEVERVDEVAPGFRIPRYRDHSDEMRFGLRGSLGLGQASALSGPFLPLLTAHAEIGVQLVLDINNHVGRWYAENSLAGATIDPVQTVTFIAENGEEIQQWGTSNLWNAYRGFSVLPNVIISSLMALEHWLLHKCRSGEDVTQWLQKIFRDSNNVLATGVLASVCTAYPEVCGGFAKTLLTSHHAVQFDLARKGKEVSRFPLPSDQMLRAQRERSNRLPHRQVDLEWLAFSLQTTGHAQAVQEIIDRHVAALPPLGERSPSDLTWRLALHRMDWRDWKSRAAEDTFLTGISEPGPRAAMVMELDRIDSDVASYLDLRSEQQEAVNVTLRLENWRIACWDTPDNPDISESWSQILELCKTSAQQNMAGPLSRSDAVVGVVATCVRHHWDEMSEPDQDWCRRLLVNVVRRNSDQLDPFGQVLLGYLAYSMVSGTKPGPFAAYVLPKILANSEIDAGVSSALAHALTHASLEVRFWAAEGVAAYLYPDLTHLASQSIGALAMIGRAMSSPPSQPNSETRPEGAYAAHFRSSAKEARTAFADAVIDVGKEIEKFRLESRHSHQEVLPLLALLKHTPDLEVSRVLFNRVAQYLLKSGALDDEESFDIDFESACRNQLTEGVLRFPHDVALEICEPLLAAVETQPQEVGSFICILVAKADEAHIRGRETNFWPIWQAFADRIVEQSAQWGVDQPSRDTARLLGEMFFGGYWKRDLRRWPPIYLQERSIDDFALSLPSSAPVMHSYSRYLCLIGESALPRALLTLERLLASGAPGELLGNRDTQMYIELVLRRCLSYYPMSLKTDPALRPAVLSLLGHLERAGSQGSYVMQEAFATPPN